MCLCVYLRVFAWFCTGLCDGVTYKSEFLDTLRYEDNHMSHMSVSCAWVRCCHVTARCQRLFPNFMAIVGNKLQWWHQCEHFHFRTVAPCCTLLFPKKVSWLIQIKHLPISTPLTHHSYFISNQKPTKTTKRHRCRIPRASRWNLAFLQFLRPRWLAPKRT